MFVFQFVKKPVDFVCLSVKEQIDFCCQSVKTQVDFVYQCVNEEIGLVDLVIDVLLWTVMTVRSKSNRSKQLIMKRVWC